MKKKLAVIAMLLAVLVFIFRIQIKAGLNSGMLLLEIIPNNSFKPLVFLTKEPVVEEVLVQSGDRQIKADVWRPKADSKRRPAAIIAYGTDVPKNKPELRALAESFARMGFVVLVPDVPELLETRYFESEKDDYINLFLFLRNQPYVDTQKVGYVSFCIGSSLSLLAAQDPRISNDVKFIFVKSVYVDSYSITRDTVTRTLSDAQVANFWQPQEKLRFVVINEMTDFIEDKGQKETVRKALFANGKLGLSQVSALSADSKAIYNYLANSDPRKSKELWDKIPAHVISKIDRISPITNMDKLKAKVFIMAATSDVYLPYTESAKLYKLLPKDRVKLVEVGFLDSGGLDPMRGKKEILKQGIMVLKYFYAGFLDIGRS